MGSTEKAANINIFKKYQHYIKKYGHLIVPVHIFTSACWFTFIYATVKSGTKLIKDVEDWTEEEQQLNSKGNFTKKVAFALAIYKLISPIRYGTTILVTHKLINFIKKGSF